jgi:peptidase E
VLVTTAANGLDDRASVIDAIVRQFSDRDRLAVVDVDGASEVGFDGHDLVVLGAGDPYRLLAAGRSCRLSAALTRALATGIDVVGVSGGAIALAGSIAPIVGVTPFDAPADETFEGFGLSPVLALPHDDRPERHRLHLAASARFGNAHCIVPIRDDQVLVVHPDGRVVRHDSAGASVTLEAR